MSYSTNGAAAKPWSGSSDSKPCHFSRAESASDLNNLRIASTLGQRKTHTLSLTLLTRPSFITSSSFSEQPDLIIRAADNTYNSPLRNSLLKACNLKNS